MGPWLAFDLENRCCAVCQHDCHCYWSRSSKAMEPDITVELANNAGKGAEISILVGDDDS